MTNVKIVNEGNNQYVILPKKYCFVSDEVNINKVGDIVLLMPKDSQWNSFRKALDMFSEDYMQDGRSSQQQRDNNISF